MKNWNSAVWKFCLYFSIQWIGTTTSSFHLFTFAATCLQNCGTSWIKKSLKIRFMEDNCVDLCVLEQFFLCGRFPTFFSTLILTRLIMTWRLKYIFHSHYYFYACTCEKKVFGRPNTYRKVFLGRWIKLYRRRRHKIILKYMKIKIKLSHRGGNVIIN